MMSPIDFAKTIYLGDRWCKQLIIDGAQKEIRLQIDVISRVRGDQWNFYTAEDLENGFLILEDVDRFEFSPQGLLPNDWIELASITEVHQGGFRFEFSLGACSPNTNGASELTLTVFARALCLASAEGRRIYE